MVSKIPVIVLYFTFLLFFTCHRTDEDTVSIDIPIKSFSTENPPEKNDDQVLKEIKEQVDKANKDYRTKWENWQELDIDLLKKACKNANSSKCKRAKLEFKLALKRISKCFNRIPHKKKILYGILIAYSLTRDTVSWKSVFGSLNASFNSPTTEPPIISGIISNIIIIVGVVLALICSGWTVWYFYAQSESEDDENRERTVELKRKKQHSRNNNDALSHDVSAPHPRRRSPTSQANQPAILKAKTRGNVSLVKTKGTSPSRANTLNTNSLPLFQPSRTMATGKRRPSPVQTRSINH